MPLMVLLPIASLPLTRYFATLRLPLMLHVDRHHYLYREYAPADVRHQRLLRHFAATPCC